MKKLKIYQKYLNDNNINLEIKPFGRKGFILENIKGQLFDSDFNKLKRVLPNHKIEPNGINSVIVYYNKNFNYKI